MKQMREIKEYKLPGADTTVSPSTVQHGEYSRNVIVLCGDRW